MEQFHTPHIKASPGDFARTVLMPGDPLRSKFIAENFIENARLVNDVRGIQGYTGTYKGVPVSVMASGMGMPSIGIYSYELFNFFGVDNIIRIGSAGSLQENIKLHDIVIAQGACTDSSYAKNFHLPGTFAPIASYKLLRSAIMNAMVMRVPYHVGNVVSSDIFYGDLTDIPDNATPAARWGKMGVMAVEMEAAALYMNAARAGKNALAICTISDHIITGENTTSDERRTAFRAMIKLALEIAVDMDNEADIDDLSREFGDE